MATTHLTQAPKSRSEMLVRKPASDVFEAIVNPDITTQFWFTHSTGRLDAGTNVRWDWEMYDVSAEVTPKAVEPSERVVIEWPGYSGPTTVTWELMDQRDGTTFVRITEDGFTGDADDLVRYAADSTQGFTLMLAGLKALLEHGIRLNLTADAHPKGLVDA
jgi:uncharacterized protein YndB with AHSA1/START domain